MDYKQERVQHEAILAYSTYKRGIIIIIIIIIIIVKIATIRRKQKTFPFQQMDIFHFYTCLTELQATMWM
jgi:hypothetical protein